MILHKSFNTPVAVGVAFALIVGLLFGADSIAYPIDGYERTGIGRLEVASRIEQGRLKGTRQPAGALLTTDQVAIRMTEFASHELPHPDTEFSGQLRA